MFLDKNTPSQRSVGCCLTDKSYSLAVIEDHKRLILNQSRFFYDNVPENWIVSLADDIERLNLIAHDCKLILLPEQYQLLLMDAPDVPETEMTKALRWNLKGLSDYDLNDVAIDMCMVPSNESDEQKKIFAAITELSALNKKRALLESVFLNVTAVTIAEMALKNLLPLMQHRQPTLRDTPFIIISLCNKIRKLHIAYQDVFYLIRELTSGETTNVDEPVELANLVLEVERSIDYCVNQLNLPEPKQLFFTPGFHHVVDFLKPIGKKLTLNVKMIDLNHYLTIDQPLDLKSQHSIFYSTTGALT